MSSDESFFEDLDHVSRTQGPSSVLNCLISEMERRDDPRGLLDGLLLKARHELGLPSILDGPLSDLPEPQRVQYEDRYVEAIRHVGIKLLARNDIVAAWPYFRAIGEKELVAAAIEQFSPGEGDSSLGHVVEVAFTQGAHPRRGFELILDHFGICSAITSFESLPPDELIRIACAERLCERLHEQLIASLRADIERHGDPLPPAGTAVDELMKGHDWLFDDDGYHLDVSHLSAVVRISPMMESREAVAKAVELTDYGRRLSDRHKYAGDAPFERTYEDHGIYLRAVLGDDQNEAIRHFQGKLPAPDPDGNGDHGPSQILVKLLLKLGRLDEAINVEAEHLTNVPEGMLMVPGLSQLCQRAGRMDRLAEVARAQGDPVRYAAAILPSR